MIAWTKEKITAMSPSGRVNLYKNARRLSTPDAVALVKLIEGVGLPYSDPTCPSDDDPLSIAIYDVVYSEKGKAAAIAAVDQGRPPLAGIDPLLFEKLGVDYGAHNMTTATAGGMIATLMRSLGYKETGKNAPLPPGSIAKTGQMWESKKSTPQTTVAKTGEFCVRHTDGRISDAELHEPILQAGDDRAGLEISRKIAREAGLSEDQIKKLYD